MTQTDPKTLCWFKNVEAGNTYVETSDGYFASFNKLNGVSVDGYLAEVHAPNWFYSARCPTAGNAKAWCRKIILSDRRAPMNRNLEAAS